MTGFEEVLINYWDSLPFIVAFIGGLLAFLSPCTLPLIPVYISMITGISIKELKENNQVDKKKIIINTLFFIFGFSLVFVLVSILVIYFSNFASKYIYSGFLFKILGIIVIITGLNIMGIIKVNFLFIEKRMNFEFKKTGYLSSILLGIVFGFGWQPCVGPILTMVMGLAAKQDSLFLGSLNLILFSLGLGIPFLLIGIFIEKSISFIEKIKKYSKAIEIISGTILVLMGIYIFF